MGGAFEVMTRRWAAAGKNTDGRPGLPWDVSLYGPLVVLMCVKNLHAREMEAYLAENVVARVFIGRQGDPQRRLGPFQHCAAYAALGKEGVDEINALILHVAKDLGFADVSILSSDTTAQELPIGYPNEPSILRGLAQRCGRAWRSSKRWRVGRRRRPRTGADDPQDGQRTPPVCQGQTGKAPGVDALAHRGRPVGGAYPPHGDAARTEPGPCYPTDHSDAYDHARGGQAPHPTDRPVDHHRGGGQGQNRPCRGLTQARAIVRHKAGKEFEFGLPYLLSRLGGGYVFGTVIRGVVDESKMPLQALAGYRAIFGAQAAPALVVYDRGGYATATVRALAKEGVKAIGIQPKGKGAWHATAEAVRETVRSERGKTEGIIGTLKTDKYGFNKPKERLWHTLEMAGPRSLLACNLNKLMRDLVQVNR